LNADAEFGMEGAALVVPKFGGAWKPENPAGDWKSVNCDMGLMKFD